MKWTALILIIGITYLFTYALMKTASESDRYLEMIHRNNGKETKINKGEIYSDENI